jgi:PST family polysaccharide transporter
VAGAKADRLFRTDESSGFKKAAVRGALAAGASQAIKIILQFISVAVLARLLAPHDFGLVAMITPVVGFSLLFQDFGLTQALVTAKDLTRTEAAAIFRINLALSFAIALIVALLSPFVAMFYHEPALTWLTVGFAAQIILAGATASHLALLTRGLRFNDLALIEVARAAVGLIVAIAIAYYFKTPWALVMQPAAGGLVAMVMAWFMTGWRPTGAAPMSHVRSMLKFGVGMTTFNISNYLSRNADNVMIGWARGAMELGLYDRAYKLLLFPLQQVNQPIGSIMIPVLSRLVDEPERYRAAYRRTLQMTMLATVPGMVFLIVVAPTLITFLLGARWEPAAPIFQWLGVAGLHQTIGNTFGWLFVSQRRTGEYARFGIFSTASCLIAFAIGLRWGATGVAAAYGLSGILVRLPAIVWKVGSTGPISSRNIVDLAVPYAISAGLAAAIWRLAVPFAPSTPLASLIFSGFVVFISFCASISCTHSGRGTLSEVFSLLPFKRGAA